MAEAPHNPSDEDAACPLSLLKRFYTLQEERVEAYRFLESGFSSYLEGAPNYNFDLYRSLVNEITESFKSISREVIALQDQFREVHGMSRIADTLNRVQMAEKQKLEHTVQLQLTRQAITDNPGDDYLMQQVNESKEKVQETVQQINDDLEDLKFESEDLYSEATDR